MDTAEWPDSSEPEAGRTLQICLQGEGLNVLKPPEVGGAPRRGRHGRATWPPLFKFGQVSRPPAGVTGRCKCTARHSARPDGRPGWATARPLRLAGHTTSKRLTTTGGWAH